MTSTAPAAPANPFDRADSPIRPIGLVENDVTGALECHVAAHSKQLVNLAGKTITQVLLCHLAGGVVWLTEHFGISPKPIQVRNFRRGIWVESYRPPAGGFHVRLAERALLKACHARGTVVIERATVFDLDGSLVWPPHRAWSGRPQAAHRRLAADQ